MTSVMGELGVAVLDFMSAHVEYPNICRRDKSVDSRGGGSMGL